MFDIAPDVPAHLVGDSLRLGQILLNYANNAVKFTEKGEIVISVRASERTERDVLLHFRVQRHRHRPARPSRCSACSRASRRPTPPPRANSAAPGLGLAISKKLAELMGGEVGVESELRQGQHLLVQRPPGHRHARSAATACRNPDLRGRRALVVDDNDHARTVIADMLAGHDVRDARRAVAAPAAVDEVRSAAVAGQSYDVVYLDWRMPGMDGMETARRIRSLGPATRPMFLMVTAYGREEVLKEAGACGIQNVLVKPVNPSVLFDTTMGVLRPARAPAPRAARTPRPAPTPRWRRCAARASCWWRTTTSTSRWRASCSRTPGCVVDVAENGEVALGAGRQAGLRPGVHGHADARDGRRRRPRARSADAAARRACPIVAMTANAMEQDRRKCMDAGMNDFLVKPIDPQEMWRPPAALGAPARAGRRPRRAAPMRRAVAARRPTACRKASRGWTRRWACRA